MKKYFNLGILLMVWIQQSQMYGQSRAPSTWFTSSTVVRRGGEGSVPVSCSPLLCFLKEPRAQCSGCLVSCPAYLQGALITCLWHSGALILGGCVEMCLDTRYIGEKVSHHQMLHSCKSSQGWDRVGVAGMRTNTGPFSCSLESIIYGLLLIYSTDIIYYAMWICDYKLKAC